MQSFSFSLFFLHFKFKCPSRFNHSTLFREIIIYNNAEHVDEKINPFKLLSMSDEIEVIYKANELRK